MQAKVLGIRGRGDSIFKECLRPRFLVILPALVQRLRDPLIYGLSQRRFLASSPFMSLRNGLVQRA
jgi:hypothetical protein